MHRLWAFALLACTGCAAFVSGDAQLQQQPAAVIQAAAPALPAAGVPSVSLHQQIATVAARGAAATLASPKPAVATPVPLPPPGTPRPAPAQPVALPTTKQPQGPGAPLPGHVNPQPATPLPVPAPVPRPAVAVEAAVKPPTAGRPAATRKPAPTTTAALATARAAAAAAAVATARAAPSRSPTRQQLPRPATAVAERGQRANSSTPRQFLPQDEAGNSGHVEVTLLHFNDWHVRVEPTKDRWCALCTSWDVQQGRCNGGLARMSAYVKAQRQQDPELLLLNAGDDFIGTEWDRKAGLDAPAAFMNLLRPDAMTIGNHEWDKGLWSLKQYLDAQTNKNVLGANIEFNGHELKDKVKPYVVKTVKGKKLCIFGLTTQYGLPGSSQMGPVKIKEPYSVGRQVVNDMKKEGCHATVLLSHLGYTSDLVAASAIPGLDLVIGGHSHTFLWPDPKAPPAFYNPSSGNDGRCCDKQADVTWGPYPNYVWGNGKNVPVVQASWGSRYMGKVVLKFKRGENRVSDVSSDITLLGGPNSDRHMQEDEEAKQLIKQWRKF